MSAIGRLVTCLCLTVSLGASTTVYAADRLIAPSNRLNAYDFVTRDINNKPIRLSDFRGKVVMVNFWATWCPPCRKEMPSMQHLWQEMARNDFHMLAVNVGEDDEQVFGFSFELGSEIDFPIVFDQHMKISRAYRVPGLPTSYLIDKNGKIAMRAIGDRNWARPKFQNAIRQLMAE